MNEFRTFIASSLKPEFLDHREKLVQALLSLNDDPDLKPLNFSSYRFETEGLNVACVGGIQNNINLNIEECHGFVLICDSNVGKKTVAEFENARQRFNRHMNPSVVIILKSKVSNPCAPNQITYEKFKEDYLSLFDYNRDGKINDDVLSYEFEFDDIDAACDKLKRDFKKWLTDSKNRILFKAELGRDISPKFLYPEHDNEPNERIKGCDDRMYFRREFDNRLDQAIQNVEPAILIKGASLSGKTRALYQAIKSNPDTWFYKFQERHDNEELAKEITEIANYVRFLNSRTPLYLIFDDVHLLPSSPETENAIERLLDAIHGKNIGIIMTSTSQEDPPIRATLTLKIKSLSKKECAEAELFLRRFGRIVDSSYKEIGAMMIDLEGMRNQYEKFTHTGDTDIDIARKCVLDAIKASSIWHNSNIGSVENLFNFTKYLLSLEFGINPTDIPKLTYDSINALTGLPGIRKEHNAGIFKVSRSAELSKYLLIEEYIYRYVIGSLSVEEEWELIDLILSFSNENNAESLVVCLSKIARRAENQKEIAGIIYDLVRNIYFDEETQCPAVNGTSLLDSSWYPSLKKEISQIREEVESNPTTRNEDCSALCVYMAKIIWSRLIFEETYEGAERIFNSVPFPLQNLPMLGALIYKNAGRNENLNEIIRSRDVEKSLYIINKMIPFASDFNQALDYFRKGEIRFTSDFDYISSTEEMRELKEKRKDQGEEWDSLIIKDINRQHLIQAVNSLASKVGSIEDLERFLEVIRENYVYLLDDLEYAKNFITSSDVYSRERLTMIDLLSRLNLYGIRGAFTNIFPWGRQIPSGLYDLTDRLIQEYAMTSKLTTVGYKAKQTVGTIFNVFIEKCEECRFQDVMENIFLKMQVQRGSEVVNLCDSYTYGGILRNRNCKYIDAIDIYNNFIEPHSQDRNGHFLITHFILNEILNKVRSVSEYNRINRIFDEHNVRKDIYTYNNVIRNLPYSTGMEEILPQMLKDEVEFDMYTIGTLVSKAPDIRIATSFFYPLIREGIMPADNMAPSDVKKVLEAKIKEFTKDLPLESQHFLWATLVEAHCRNEEDRAVLFKVLEFLERPQNRSRIFGERDNGIIYNNCIKNRSFIRNYEEAKSFIISKGITPDSYTLGQLLRIIIDEYKGTAGYEQDITYHLNDIYRKNREVVIKEIKDGNTHIYNERLKAYNSHADKLSFLFIYSDGSEKTLSLTPMEYIRHLVEEKLPVDQYTLSCFAEIEKGQSYQLLEQFLEFTRSNNLYINHYAIDNLVKLFKKTIPESQRVTMLGAIYELPINDNIISQSKATVNMYSHKLCSLNEAFRRVTGNPTEKLYCYTQLLSQFRKFQLSNRQTTAAISNDFRLCMNLYKEFIANENIQTNADIFSNLANFATNRSELEEVLNEMQEAGVKPISYILTPILRVSKSLEEIKELIQIYIALGGSAPGRDGSEGEVDAILHGLSLLLRKNKDADIHRIITELTEYVLSSAPSSTVLGDFPAFRIYKTENEGDRLTQNALCELINYWPDLEDEAAADEKYLSNLSKLLKRYYHPENDAIRPKLVQAVKYVSDNRKISYADILDVLRPYPKLAFMFAAEKPVDGYETYKILVKIWNDSFEKIQQDEAIGVLLTQLETKEFSDIIWKILPGIFKKWKTGITTRDFLQIEDNLDNDPAVITKYAENDRLRRKYLNSRFRLRILNSKQEYTKEGEIKLYIKLFKDEMSDASFVKSELGTFIKDKRLKFNDIKPILEAIIGNKDSMAALLCHMADRMESYGNLYFIIETISSESVEISEDLGQKLVFGIMRKKYDDHKFRLVAEQILLAIDEDRLQLKDLLYVPTSLPRESLANIVRISKDLKALCRLLSIMSNGMGGLSSHGMIEYAEELICNHYCSSEEGKSIIDTLLIQEFLRLHIDAYNKHDDKAFMEEILKKIKEVLSVHVSEKIDTSVLFSEETRTRLKKNEFWYEVKSGYISRMLLKSLNCSNKEKLEIVISAGSQDFWWDNAFKGQFEVLLSYTPEVEAMQYSSPEKFIMNLFIEAGNPEEFMLALKFVLSGRISIRNEVIITDSMLRIIGKEERYVNRIVSYNERLYKTSGRYSSLTNAESSWIPDSEFFNTVFSSELLDESADYVLEDLFRSMRHMKTVSRFVNEMRIMKAMKDPKFPGKKSELLVKHISANHEYFYQGGKIENDLLTAAYIRSTRSASDIIKKILDKSTYNASMLPSCEGRSDIFDGRMGRHVFKELSHVIEWNREKACSRITTQKLLHNLLLGCGNEFIIENPDLLVEIAGTIRTLDEYRRFTNDLMTFYIPVSSELLALLIETLMNLEEEDQKNWLLKKVSGRVRALAEFDHYHQGSDCQSFKAGYLLLQQEASIDFSHYWTRENLHLKDSSTENTLKRILSYRFIDRLYAVNAIDAPDLKCEVMVKMFANNPDLNKYEKTKIWEMMYNVFEKFAQTLNCADGLNIKISSIYKIFKTLIKNEIKVPKELSQQMLLGLVNYYRMQQDNENLGSYYKANVSFVLNFISKICDKNKEEKYTKIYYNLFSNSKSKGQAFFLCKTKVLIDALK